MNCKEHHLPELELSTGQVREALQCILHTILLYVSNSTLPVCIRYEVFKSHVYSSLPPVDCYCTLLVIMLSLVTHCFSLRSPGPVTPRDIECEGFHLTYTRIAGSNHDHSSALNTDVDQKVDDAIESFLRTLSQIGPELLSGCLTLSFFERRATRQLFGLVSHEERVM
jgi:Autophagy-related protein 101